jgi:type VI secretion system secreted protein VgrG
LTNEAGTALTNKAGTSLSNEASLGLKNKAGHHARQRGHDGEQQGLATQTVDGGGMLTVKGGLVKIN